MRGCIEGIKGDLIARAERQWFLSPPHLEKFQLALDVEDFNILRPWKDTESVLKIVLKDEAGFERTLFFPLVRLDDVLEVEYEWPFSGDMAVDEGRFLDADSQSVFIGKLVIKNRSRFDFQVFLPGTVQISALSFLKVARKSKKRRLKSFCPGEEKITFETNQRKDHFNGERAFLAKMQDISQLSDELAVDVKAFDQTELGVFSNSKRVAKEFSKIAKGEKQRVSNIKLYCQLHCDTPKRAFPLKFSSNCWKCTQGKIEFCRDCQKETYRFDLSKAHERDIFCGYKDTREQYFYLTWKTKPVLLRSIYESSLIRMHPKSVFIKALGPDYQFDRHLELKESTISKRYVR